MAYSIRNILDQVFSGQIRIPAFQRGFVWEMDRVAYFMDSIYKGYPFGSLLFWRTTNRLTFERSLGPFTLPPAEPDYPINYVLDGQQRVTSIFAVFQSELELPSDSQWKNIYFDLAADGSAQDSQFLALDEADVDTERHFLMSTLFDSVRYREATAGLNEAKVRVIDSLQEVFKEAQIPVQLLETEDNTKVAIVFERINRLGVELDTLQLLTAWTWSEEFDLQQKFDSLSADLEAYGFAAVGEDTDLVLRCAAAVINNNPSAESLIGLNGADVRAAFGRVETGIKGAIDFLQSQLHVESLHNLPYPALLIPLSVFFAEEPGTQGRYSNEQLAAAKRWFWRACFSRRYSGQSVRAARVDVGEMVRLKQGLDHRLGEFNHEIDEWFFTGSQFRMASANTKTFILLLAQQRPVSFLSGNAVDLRMVLLSYNRTEFHHMFPRSYLRDRGIGDNQANALANFCFMSRTDNNRISSKAPSVYRGMMPQDESLVDRTLQQALVPRSLFTNNYKLFLSDRALMLVARARELMNAGLDGSLPSTDDRQLPREWSP